MVGCASLFNFTFALCIVLLTVVDVNCRLGCMLVLWGLVATLCAFITNAAQFMTLRFLLGIAECGAFPGSHMPSLFGPGRHSQQLHLKRVMLFAD